MSIRDEVEEALYLLIDQGLVEASSIDEEGRFLYSLTEEGQEFRSSYEDGEENDEQHA